MLNEFHDTAGDAPRETTSRPPIGLDVARYQAMLDDSDLSEDQKQEFLETLWQIIVQFVDLGFGVHPLQSIPSDKADRAISLDDLLASVVSSGSSENNKAIASSPPCEPGGIEES